MKKKGLVLQGNEITIKKIVIKSQTSDIDNIVMPSDDNDVIYNILGVRVTEMKPGNIYIRNGKKVIVR